MIITIDGPAGAGKSTVAKALAQRLGFRFLDTGAMYRAVALAAMRRGLDGSQTDEIVALTGQIEVIVEEDGVLLDGDDVTAEIRTPEVTANTHWAADNPGVREQLVEWQRRIGESENIVSEGRDQGTVVFPDAQCKIFLTATPEERARRRARDLAARGETLSEAEVLAQQTQRDHRDQSRSCGPLVAAKDAVEVITDGLSQEEVVDRIAKLVP
ncbi:MAG: (d)CMP kinase [Planctomycetes bacterium]|nr:(d)CMP kinase [Planctomycetota bacterium]